MEAKQKLYSYYLKRCQEEAIESDLFDFQAEIGSDLSYAEGITQLEENFFSKIPSTIEPTKKQIEALNKQFKYVQNNNNKMDFSALATKKIILVFGDTRSGKTSLSFKILEEINKKKTVFVYNHPFPKSIDLIGFENVANMSDLGRLSDCAVYVDEPQLLFPVEDKKSNGFLAKLYTLCGQRSITLILSTSDSRWVTKGTESFVNSWFIKDCEAELLKNGSKIKNIIRQHSTFGLIDFRMKVDEFLFYDRSEMFSGKFVFNLPYFWHEIFSKPYKLR